MCVIRSFFFMKNQKIVIHRKYHQRNQKLKYFFLDIFLSLNRRSCESFGLSLFQHSTRLPSSSSSSSSRASRQAHFKSINKRDAVSRILFFSSSSFWLVRNVEEETNKTIDSIEVDCSLAMRECQQQKSSRAWDLFSSLFYATLLGNCYETYRINIICN